MQFESRASYCYTLPSETTHDSRSSSVAIIIPCTDVIRLYIDVHILQRKGEVSFIFSLGEKQSLQALTQKAILLGQ